MKQGLIGEKIGMTTWMKGSQAVPVTVVKAGPCYVTAVLEEGGQKKIELGFKETKAHRLAKPQRDYFKKHNLPFLKERKVFEIAQDRKIGDKIDVSLFTEGERVDVRGTSIGRGFQGVMRRFGYRGGPDSHGSMAHRKLQSAGDTNPAKVHKGKGMPGRMGGHQVCVKNLEVIAINREHGLLFLKGAVPGKKGGTLFICKK